MARLRRLGDVAIVVLAIVMDLIAWAGDRSVRGGPMLPLLIVPALTVVVYATLLLRWRRPVIVFTLQWGFALSSLVVPEFQPFAGLLVSLHALAARRDPPQSVTALASTAVPFSIYSYNTAERGAGGFGADFSQLLVLWMLLATAAWGVGRLSYASAHRAWRLRELQAAEAADAARAERLRLARELHDIVAHTVTIMMIQASGAKAVLDTDPDRARQALDVIEKSGVQAMSELHRMLMLLRSVSPESASESVAAAPGVADIAVLVKLATDAGRDVTLSEQGVRGPLDPSVATAAYRIVQESLTNSAKHAGTAAEVRIELRWSDDALELTVTDRTRGAGVTTADAAKLSSGHGLAGLRERVTMVGGWLSFGPRADGFRVRARLPRPGVLGLSVADQERAR